MFMSKKLKFISILSLTFVSSSLVSCGAKVMSDKDLALSSLINTYKNVNSSNFSKPESLKIKSSDVIKEESNEYAKYYNPKYNAVYHRYKDANNDVTISKTYEYYQKYSGGYAAIFLDKETNKNNLETESIEVKKGYVSEEEAVKSWNEEFSFNLDTYIIENTSNLIVNLETINYDKVSYSSKDLTFSITLTSSTSEGTKEEWFNYSNNLISSSGYKVTKDNEELYEYNFNYYWNYEDEITFETIDDNTIISSLYTSAVNDAAVATNNEIYDLVTLTKNDKNVIWNDDYSKVLLMTFHHYPTSYVEGSTVTINWESWNTSVGEFKNLYASDFINVENKELRLKQILGMPSSNTNTYISAMWVDPSLCYRPARVSDATKNDMQITLNSSETDDFKTWFNNNYMSSYLTGWTQYPWTGLGYTYDWGDSAKEYGLSEFLITKGSEVEVYFTKTIDEFASWAIN